MKSNTPKIYVVEVNQPNINLIAKGILIATRNANPHKKLKEEDRD
ncbi:hypothetical protein [Rummeliibacillus sp. G93]|nr:hypothetical protein [Rummeliibacillus sp. G93]